MKTMKILVVEEDATPLKLARLVLTAAGQREVFV
jgi:hypothetical protein